MNPTKTKTFDQFNATKPPRAIVETDFKQSFLMKILQKPVYVLNTYHGPNTGHDSIFSDFTCIF